MEVNGVFKERGFELSLVLHDQNTSKQSKAKSIYVGSQLHRAQSITQAGLGGTHSAGQGSRVEKAGYAGALLAFSNVHCIQPLLPTFELCSFFSSSPQETYPETHLTSFLGDSKFSQVDDGDSLLYLVQKVPAVQRAEEHSRQKNSLAGRKELCVISGVGG